MGVASGAHWLYAFRSLRITYLIGQIKKLYASCNLRINNNILNYIMISLATRLTGAGSIWSGVCIADSKNVVAAKDFLDYRKMQ